MLWAINPLVKGQIHPKAHRISVCPPQNVFYFAYKFVVEYKQTCQFVSVVLFKA